jgi:hypothetical protein
MSVAVDIEEYQPDAHAHGYIAHGGVTMDQVGRFGPLSIARQIEMCFANDHAI